MGWPLTVQTARPPAAIVGGADRAVRVLDEERQLDVLVDAAGAAARRESGRSKEFCSMSETKSVNATLAGTISVGGDLTVNRLGFGAMRITGDGIWGQPADRDEAKAVLRRAVEVGVNFIDTADSYGPDVSEELISETLYPYPEDLVIATKGGLERPGPGRWLANGRPEHLIEACEGSLRRLKLERIPLYQFHRPDPAVPLEDSIGALVTLKEQGKIRHIGVSNVTEEQLRRAQRLTPIVSIQNRYNVDDRESESLVDLCEQEHLVFLPWAPIQDLDSDRIVQELAQRHGATPRQIVLAWLLARSPSILPIPGTGSVSHLDDNVAAAAITLTAAEVAAVTHSAG
jgi:aryl-alcohol dehydrogenase-like predicted oxidoreductase